MSPVDLLGYAASATVLATFCMRTMIPLRVVALGSNVLFIGYGYFDNLPPVLLLHLVLFPVNAVRLFQFQRLVREMRDAHTSELSLKSLLPYMRRVGMGAGEVLVRRGDKADRLYYLSEGELEISEFKKVLKAGAVIGEIGVFAANQVRTATVIARTDCKLLELTEQKARELYFQDRSFSFAVLQLIIQRLTENNEHLLQSRSGLRRLWAQPLTTQQIAGRMARASETVTKKAAELGLPPRSPGSVRRFRLPSVTRI